MSPAVALAELKRGRVRAAYLLVGDDQLAIDRVTAAVCACLAGEGKRGPSAHQFRAGESPGRDVAETLRTLPMFGSRRVVIIREPEGFPRAEQQLVAEAIQSCGPGCHVLVVSAREGSEPVARAAAAAGLTVRCRTPFPAQLPAWVQEEARQVGLRMDLQAAALLVDRLGSDRAVLAQEVEKLRLLLGDGARVGQAEVEDTATAAGSVFRLIDAVGRGQPGTVARLIAGSLRSGERPLVLLALFVGHLRRLWRVHELLRAGCSPEKRAAELRVWGSRLEDLEAQARGLPEGALHRALAQAADLDVSIKSGRGDPNLLVESYLIELARSAAERRSGTRGG